MKSIIKRCVVGIIALAMIMSFIACGNQKQGISNETTRTITDMSGNEIEIPNEINNYAVAWAGLTDIVAMFDDFEHCVAFPEKSTKFELLFKLCPKLEGKLQLPDKGISAEALVELNVQVVFLKASDDEKLIQKLKQCGISVIDCEFKDYEGLESVVKIIGDTFGTEDSKQIEIGRAHV